MKSTAFSLFVASAAIASPINNDAHNIAPRQGAHGGGQGSWQQHCNSGPEKYENIVVSEHWAGAPIMKDGLGCESLVDETCELAREESWYQETTISVGAEFGVGAGPTKAIWEAAASFNMGYSWTWGKGEATSGTVICPKGKITCGLQITPYWVTVTGKIVDGADTFCDKKPTRDFNIRATYLAPGTDKSDADFKACAKRCQGDACAAAKAESLSPCPGYTIAGW